MRRWIFFAVVLCGTLLFILGSTEDSFAQTAIGNPSGTSVSYSPAADINIGKGTGRTGTYTNSSWPSSCVGWGVPHTLTAIVNGANTGSCTGLANLTYNAGQSNLNGGVAVFTGTTSYRYILTTGGYTTNTNIPVRLTMTTKTTGNVAIPLCDKNSKIFMGVTGNFKVTLFIEAQGPSDAVYFSGGSGWDGAVDLYDRLHTPTTGYSVCTAFDDGTFYSLSASTTTPSNVSPADNSSTFAASVTLNWSGTIGASCPSYYQYQVNGSSWTTVGTTSSVNSGTLNWGANTWRIRYYDGCNNQYYYGPTWTIYRVTSSLCGTTIDHGGNNWTISSNTTVSGYHINVGNFVVNSGITATVASGCEFSVKATNITNSGTIDGNGSGSNGGAAESGGGGCWSQDGATDCRGITYCWDKDNCKELRAYGGNGGNAGSGSGPGGVGGNGNYGRGSKQECQGWDDDGGGVQGGGGGGGAGGGAYGGNGGAGKNGGNGGAGNPCSSYSNCYSLITGTGGSGGSAGGAFGNATTYVINMGSGGGSGGRGGRGRNGPGNGAAGGNGGGSVELIASNNLTVSGTIRCNGSTGGAGGAGGSAGNSGECCDDWSGGCDESTRTGGGGGGAGGGGGSGGGILLSANGIMNLDGTFQTIGGNGGAGGAGGASGGGGSAGTTGHGGAAGGGGRIKLFYNPCNANDLTSTFSYGGGGGGGGASTGNGGSIGTKEDVVFAITPGGSNPPANRYVWNGSVSTAWLNGANWSYFDGSNWTWGTVPGTTADVIVPGPPCVPNNPTISSNAGTIKSLEIHSDDGAEVTITCADCLIVTD